MSNPFQGWTMEQVQNHNRRVASKAARTIAELPVRKERTIISERDVQQTPAGKSAKRIRQSSKGLNKLESEYFAILKREGGVTYLRPHAKTYLLANGVRYTPDFTALVQHGGCVTKETAWEVKGPHAWEDAMIKIKVAATAFPEVKWLLVWKDKGQWQCQEVLP